MIRALVLAAAVLPALAGPAPEPPAYKGNPRQYWMDVCARCHGALGDGRDAAGRPLPDAGFDFTDARKANRRKDDAWVKATLEGKEKMPAFKARLSEADARALIAQVLRPFAARR